MNTLVSVAALFDWVGQNSKQASVVVVLILIAQWIFRKRLSPQWRSALWLLLLVRLLWPMSFESPVSIYNVLPVSTRQTPITNVSDANKGAIAPPASTHSRLASLPQTIWLAGAAVLSAIVAFNAFQIWRRIRRERPLTDSAILNLLEDCKDEMQIHTPLTIIETRHTAAPLLCGFIRPRLLLPVDLTKNFSRDELRHIFLHELSHLKRGDIPLNWLATILLVLHWFNPFVWLAIARMRLDREIACDALALRYSGAQQNSNYGETIIRLVEQFSRPARAPGVVGIIEDKNQIKRRIQMIAQSKHLKPWRALAIILFATLGIIGFAEAQTPKEPQQPAPAAPAAAPKGNVPQIVKTTPEVGAKDIDPAIKEITITFDRDMAGGFSWTGGPPEFPPGRPGEKPTWRNKRTCSLPVTLEAAKYYRVGINSKSHQNFRSADGTPVKPSVIYFTTKGATGDVLEKTTKPQIVSITPKNGATDVDPKTTELRVTFNVPMKNGFSWTGGGPSFPPAPEGKRPFWTEDQKTCVLPVELAANSEYRIGLNSPSAKNFQSANGIPLDPVAYTFKTKTK